MLQMKPGRLTVALLAISALQAVPAVPAVAQTTNECSAFAIRRCNGGGWATLGYVDLKDCRLTEYANCMAGIPPIDPLSFKPSVPNANPPLKNIRLTRANLLAS